MTVLVTSRDVTRAPIGRPRLRQLAASFLVAADVADAELSVMLCSNAVIRELNLAYRAEDKPTDVLSFESGMDAALPGIPRVLGDVVISVDKARAQAEEHGIPISHEIAYLLAHGILHLLGHDHRDAAEEAAMNRETARLVVAAGLPEPRDRLGVEKSP